MQTPKTDDIIHHCLEKYNEELSKIFGDADVIAFRAPLVPGVDSAIKNYVEGIRDKRNTSKKRLVVFVETNGGYIEVVERIYAVFRKYYKEVFFVVPNCAYSAGTVLVLSGDAIYMNYYSVLGPIDPQYGGEDGQLLPAIGYLHKFNELVEKINKDKTGRKTRAELAYLIKKFEPTKLFHIEQARDHSKTLLKAWLPRHKFKNWKVTATGKRKVTPQYKSARAARIAEILAEPKRWHSHGRGIGIAELESEEINLKINDYGKDDKMNKAIQPYYELFRDYCGTRKMEHAIHGPIGLRGIP